MENHGSSLEEEMEEEEEIEKVENPQASTNPQGESSFEDVCINNNSNIDCLCFDDTKRNKLMRSVHELD